MEDVAAQVVLRNSPFYPFFLQGSIPQKRACDPTVHQAANDMEVFFFTTMLNFSLIAFRLYTVGVGKDITESYAEYAKKPIQSLQLIPIAMPSGPFVDLQAPYIKGLAIDVAAAITYKAAIRPFVVSDNSEQLRSVLYVADLVDQMTTVMQKAGALAVGEEAGGPVDLPESLKQYLH